MSLREELIEGLWNGGITSPRMEAEIILRYAAPNYPTYTASENEKAKEIMKRRINHEPMDKILGFREFYKYTFKVTKDVLSPRPDTEILLESALSAVDKNKPQTILDLGTGSGCILLSLLKECQKAKGTGVDISEAALKVASENAVNLAVADRVEFINESWNDIDFSDQKYDIIVSNPPYIPSAEILTLEKEVKDNDPIVALDGGKDGYKCYKDIAKLVPNILKTNGYIFLEAGYGQAEEISRIFVSFGLSEVAIKSDLSGIKRCVILKK